MALKLGLPVGVSWDSLDAFLLDIMEFVSEASTNFYTKQLNENAKVVGRV